MCSMSDDERLYSTTLVSCCVALFEMLNVLEILKVLNTHTCHSLTGVF